MLSDLFKALFGGGSSSAGSPRDLRKPSDLREGDIVVFGLSEQPELSGKRFELAAPKVYVYESDAPRRVVYELKGESAETFYFSVLRRGGLDVPAVSRRLKRSDVYALFGDSQIGEVVGEGFSEVKLLSSPSAFSGWTAQTYFEYEDAVPAQTASADDSEGRDARRLDYYLLADGDETRGVEIEVYQGGETEVFLTVYLGTSSVAEMWPGEGRRAR